MTNNLIPAAVGAAYELCDRACAKYQRVVNDPKATQELKEKHRVACAEACASVSATERSELKKKYPNLHKHAKAL